MWLFSGLGLWCTMPLSKINQFYRGESALLVEESEVPVETTDLSQVIDKLYHIILYQVHLVMIGVRTHNISGDGH